MRPVFPLALAIAMMGSLAMTHAQSIIRVGVIGLDTSHAGAFAKIMREAPANSPMSKLKIVAAFPGGSPDIPSSIDRVPNYTKEFQSQGIEIVDSIEALLQKVDAVMLNSLDGRKHLEQVLPVFKSGKRVFIDKPLAADLTDAIAIAKLAEHYKTPWFTSSSLRFTPTVYRYREKSDRKILGAHAWSPCSLEPHHTDLTWYGIHGVEALYTAMGVGCEEVTRTKTEGTDVVVGRWKDGRVGVFRGIRSGTQGYGLTVFGADFLENDAKYEGYEPLVVEIAKFFAGGATPVLPQESVEIMAFIQAAQQSSDSKGMPVSVQSVMEKATEQADKKTQAMIR
jgi:hypothetical protein